MYDVDVEWMIKNCLIILNFRFRETETFLTYANTNLGTIGASSGLAYVQIFNETAVPKMVLNVVSQPISDYYLYRVSNNFYYVHL